MCSGGQSSNVTELHASCDTCVCNGSIDASQFKDCNHMKDMCFMCQSNDTRLDCQQCPRNNKDDDNSLSENCVMLNENKVKENVEERQKPGRFNSCPISACFAWIMDMKVIGSWEHSYHLK